MRISSSYNKTLGETKFHTQEFPRSGSKAEDGIRDLVRSRGLGDVYKRQTYSGTKMKAPDLTATVKSVLYHRSALKRSRQLTMSETLEQSRHLNK